ncbi:biotin/lipoyl-binding protein, partial [Edaphobacter sp. HDX4]|uniref:biotin/lipoyl-binding protein n=1 Tax=Edaphobacter sp. HDX4 TaxID=2794064 RepID=UPI002FE636D6
MQARGCRRPGSPGDAGEGILCVSLAGSRFRYIRLYHKGRRSATLQPQVEGNLTKILVKSGDSVRAGQVLMQIDPLKQS